MSSSRQNIFRSPGKPKPKSTFFVLLITLFLITILVFSFTTKPHHHRTSAKPVVVFPAGILPFYIIPLPPKFNSDLLSNCSSLNTHPNICPYITNSGLGERLAADHWFSTHQFIAELIFHNRALNHPCRTLRPDTAKLFYVPFYSGLYASSVFRLRNLTDRDSLSIDLVDHITSLPWWKTSFGKDHFIVSGRTAWDFLRPETVMAGEDFGANKLFRLEAVRNMSVLTVERKPWEKKLRQHGIPYPSYFHPTKVGELATWQERVLATRRTHLFSFVGATRQGLEKAAVRNQIIRQCTESSKCNLLDCSAPSQKGLCYNPSRVMRVMERSTFCLQAAGDSYTRRSTFDAMLAGCIPVFFSEHTAYSQYKWYLPKEKDSYSVFIDEKADDVARIEAVLAAIPEEKVEKMRENMVKNILPRVTYMHPNDRVGDDVGLDAVDVALKALSDELIVESTTVIDQSMTAL